MQSNNQEEDDERKTKKMKKEQEEKAEEIVNITMYLVEDIVVQILVKIPVESLFNTFRYVCKSWFNIISNHPSIHLHRLLRSKPPFLIFQTVDNTSREYLNSGDISAHEEEEDDHTYTTSFIKMDKQGIKEQFDLTPGFKKLRIRACCDGLILATPSGLNNITTLCVVNPLTNHQVRLPPRPLDSDLHFARHSYSETIKFVFNPSAEEYQVIVGGFRPGNGFLQRTQSKSYIQILTLSADDCRASSNNDGHGHHPHREWRLIEAPERVLMFQLMSKKNFSWIWGGHNGITFDVNTEKFYDISPPINHEQRTRAEGFMEMGTFLSYYLIGTVNEQDDFWTLRINILKDIDSGEWIHQYSIKIDPSFFRPPEIHTPVLSFGNGEVLIFRKFGDKTLRAYNVKSNRWWKVENNSKECDEWSFIDFHVSNKYVPLESLYAN